MQFWFLPGQIQKFRIIATIIPQDVEYQQHQGLPLKPPMHYWPSE